MSAPGAATSFVVEGGHALRGTVAVPGDKSISHRALLLGALAEGRSRLGGLSDGDDVARTAAAVTALGAYIDGQYIQGGTERLHAPDGPLDLGNSGTTIRLLAGVVAGWPWTTQLVGDASLSSRPMDRVAEPLRRMGAVVQGRGERCLPPLQVRGGALHGIDYQPPMASAQVKSCVLLAGLRAEGETVVREPVATRAHTEEMLEMAGAQVSVIEHDGGRVVRLAPSTLHAFELDVPGDPSHAAFWVVAGCVVAGSEVTVRRIYTGSQRRGFLDVLCRMGADIDEELVVGPGELTTSAHVTTRPAALRGTEIDAHEITGLDEVPALAVAAACARGTTVFRDVGELRVKESDRLSGTVELVRSFGAHARVEGDDLVVTGTDHVVAATIDARGDHRMAMAGAVAAMAADGDSIVVGWDAVATSYPAFATDLAALGGAGKIAVAS